MNERIRELIKSLGIIPEDEHYEVSELIIRECADVLVAEMNRLDGLGRVFAAQTMDTAQVLIKQHFGVQE